MIDPPSPPHILGSENAISADSCVLSFGRSYCRASDRPPEERSNQRISEHAQLRAREAIQLQIANSRYASTFSRRDAPEVCVSLSLERKEGAGNAGCALHPRSRVQNG